MSACVKGEESGRSHSCHGDRHVEPDGSEDRDITNEKRGKTGDEKGLPLVHPNNTAQVGERMAVSGSIDILLKIQYLIHLTLLNHSYELIYEKIRFTLKSSQEQADICPSLTACLKIEPHSYHSVHKSSFSTVTYQAFFPLIVKKNKCSFIEMQFKMIKSDKHTCSINTHNDKKCISVAQSIKSKFRNNLVLKVGYVL